MDWQAYGAWDKMSLVLLAVDGEEQLSYWKDKLNTEYKSEFKEPYWQDRLTAVAAFGEHIQDQVKELNLL
jgi:hypothetical protein